MRACVLGCALYCRLSSLTGRGSALRAIGSSVHSVFRHNISAGGRLLAGCAEGGCCMIPHDTGIAVSRALWVAA